MCTGICLAVYPLRRRRPSCFVFLSVPGENGDRGARLPRRCRSCREDGLATRGSACVYWVRAESTAHTRVLFTLNCSFYPSTSSTPSVRADYPPREIRALWSQNHDTEILHCSAESRVDNAMTERRTKETNKYMHVHSSSRRCSITSGGGNSSRHSGDIHDGC